MAAPRRATAPAPAPVMAGVNFGDSSLYSGGVFIPAGNYAVYHDVILYTPKDKQGQTKANASERLGVMVTFYPFSNPTEEGKLTQFYSMGGKAHESFQPNPDTGKGIVAIPGTSGTLNDKTNWFIYKHSLDQSGLPAGIFTNDVSTIDGTWVHIGHEDEPAERASYQSATSEVEQAPRKANKIAVVTEILEGGAPWDGGGGVDVDAINAYIANNTAATAVATPARPVAATRPAPAATRPVAARPVAAAAVRPAAVAPVAAPVQEAQEIDETVVNAATEAVYNILTIKPTGLPRATLRTDTFKEVKKLTKDEAMAASVIDNYFEPGMEANLTELLAPMNYSVQGPMVKPIA